MQGSSSPGLETTVVHTKYHWIIFLFSLGQNITSATLGYLYQLPLATCNFSSVQFSSELYCPSRGNLVCRDRNKKQP